MFEYLIYDQYQPYLSQTSFHLYENFFASHPDMNETQNLFFREI